MKGLGGFAPMGPAMKRSRAVMGQPEAMSGAPVRPVGIPGKPKGLARFTGRMADYKGAR